MNFTDYVDKNYNFKLDDQQINKIIEKIKKYVDTKENIYVAGCGGSGYTASHFVQDLIKVCGANAKSLSEPNGLLSAISNDIGFDQVFQFQLERLNQGLLIVFSYSGNSESIINATLYALKNNFDVISFTGMGGKLKSIKHRNKLNININNINIYVVESIHSILCHFIINVLEGNIE